MLPKATLKIRSSFSLFVLSKILLPNLGSFLTSSPISFFQSGEVSSEKQILTHMLSLFGIGAFLFHQKLLPLMLFLVFHAK